MEEEVTVPLTEKTSSSLRTDLATGSKHILAPALIGAICGGVWQQYGLPQFQSVFAPNPVQFALLTMLVLSPVMYRLLVHTSFQRGMEYSLGFAALALPLCVIWLSGWGAMFCGMYAILLAWGSASMVWARQQLPPFSYGIWHAMGADLGAFAGALVMYNILS
jgi:hypothetical protein